MCVILFVGEFFISMVGYMYGFQIVLSSIVLSSYLPCCYVKQGPQNIVFPLAVFDRSHWQLSLISKILSNLMHILSLSFLQRRIT